jgi:hypothetical protein
VSDVDHANVTRMREALDAYAARDWDAMRTHLDERIVWHVSGDHPLSGTYVGVDRVLEYLQCALGLTNGTLRLDVDEVLANDDVGAVILRARAERDGRQLDVHMAEAIRFGEDGRWAEFWALSDEQARVDEFWS